MPDLDPRLEACAAVVDYEADATAIARAVIDEWLRQPSSIAMREAAGRELRSMEVEGHSFVGDAAYETMCAQARREING